MLLLSRPHGKWAWRPSHSEQCPHLGTVVGWCHRVATFWHSSVWTVTLPQISDQWNEDTSSRPLEPQIRAFTLPSFLSQPHSKAKSQTFKLDPHSTSYCYKNFQFNFHPCLLCIFCLSKSTERWNISELREQRCVVLSLSVCLQCPPELRAPCRKC